LIATKQGKFEQLSILLLGTWLHGFDIKGEKSFGWAAALCWAIFEVI
jgi:hypothetical protein